MSEAKVKFPQTKTFRVTVEVRRLRQMRQDLDSEAKHWARPPSGGMAKEQAIGGYLDELLRLFGESGVCPTCDQPLPRKP